MYLFRPIRQIQLGEEKVFEESTKETKTVSDIGEQKCLAFSPEGTLLACGGDDGSLRLFSWPSLELKVFKEKLAKDSIQVRGREAPNESKMTFGRGVTSGRVTLADV